MNNCMYCGATVSQELANKYVCTGCGKSHYINPKAGVAIVLYDDDKNLILGRRLHQPQKGKLDTVGGFLDGTEDFDAAMYRELKEETGLNSSDVEHVEFLGTTNDPYEWEGHVINVASVHYLVKVKTGVHLVAADDLDEIVYVPINKAKGLNLAWDGMSKMLAEAVVRISSK